MSARAVTKMEKRSRNGIGLGRLTLLTVARSESEQQCGSGESLTIDREPCAATWEIRGTLFWLQRQEGRAARPESCLVEEL